MLSNKLSVGILKRSVIKSTTASPVKEIVVLFEKHQRGSNNQKKIFLLKCSGVFFLNLENVFWHMQNQNIGTLARLNSANLEMAFVYIVVPKVVQKI